MSWTIFGINFIIWGVVGLVRYASERLGKHKEREEQPWSVSIRKVAALVPAHNEQANIAATLEAIRKILPATNIYVGSDASSDRTFNIAQSFGVHVHDIQPNHGKAGVLEFMIKEYKLLQRYDALLFVDADTEIDKNYLEKSLPYFDDPRIVAVGGHAKSKWHHHKWPKLPMVFIAYRVKLYALLQALLRYGQSWKDINTSPIIPGFASIYRTSALSKINIAAPGLAIEDFNMTFEVHHKNLGQIAYTPQAFAVTHDPYNLRDYIKQVQRWNLGLWQTIKLHGFWPSLFSLMLIIFIIENLATSIFVFALPFVLTWLAFQSFEPLFINLFQIGTLTFTFLNILIGVFLFDYILTALVAAVEKKPIMLLYGLLFIPLRIIDSFLLLYALLLTFIVKSTGKWASPQRDK